ncbi:hypothetical protein U1Q18_029570 [Sarracenia purpurea var. burkii]
MPSSCSVATLFMEDRRLIKGLTTGDVVRRNSSLLAIAVALDGAGGEDKWKKKGHKWCIGGGMARAQSLF